MKMIKTIMKNNMKNYIISSSSVMWLNAGLIEQRDLKLAIGERNLSTMNGIKKHLDSKPKSWHYIGWKKAETKIKDLQGKIVIATLDNEFKEVYKLQWIIISCFEAKALAIRRVIANKGGKTAGVDGKVWRDPYMYWEAIDKLTEVVRNPANYKAEPVRRVYTNNYVLIVENLYIMGK